MPCQSDEEEMQRPDSPAPVTPTKSLGNDGAGHDNPEAENSSAESDDDYGEEEEPATSKKRKRVMLATLADQSL